VTNVIRHSRARRCRIRLGSRDGALQVEIDDDGGGRIRMDGNGIQGMRARIESLGGSLHIGSRNASSLTATIPVEPT
jgi:two-component system sensor histidine kinase DesK